MFEDNLFVVNTTWFRFDVAKTYNHIWISLFKRFINICSKIHWCEMWPCFIIIIIISRSSVFNKKSKSATVESHEKYKIYSGFFLNRFSPHTNESRFNNIMSTYVYQFRIHRIFIFHCVFSPNCKHALCINKHSALMHFFESYQD